jgi:hypothetical protein
MTAPFKTWKVLPHGKLTEVEGNILTVEGDIPMPVGEFHRRMTVVRVQSGQLVIFSAIALDEDQMRQLEAWGRPAWLVVPNDHHRLDARAWKDRFPDIQVITPIGAREKVEKAVPVDAVSADFGDATVVLIDVPGTQSHEAALEVTGANGLTLVINDLIGNIRGETGFGGWLLRRMGFAGDEPHLPGPVKAAIVKDKATLAAQLERWAAMPTLKRIVVSHGEIIEDDPQGALRTLAASMA